ncbi:hypothetical protein BD311DRAFT_802540 [Dichomitus squalens]|uniref:Uncharacterized protein n=1 Tax=Dichomitus squalens TaxID=114155 RepID=A0A4Q9N514_9APHY|nr:hypothetical protein BD311DRAFT_802540 [Dichomitus squalens]
MPSMHIDDFGHNHGLHVVIPTTEASSSVPSATASNASDGPTALDTPGHNHNLGRFAAPASAPQSARALDTPGHNHNLSFGWPPSAAAAAASAAGDEAAATPTTPRASARVSRRSSLFSVADDSDAKTGAGSLFSVENGLGEVVGHTHVVLPPTSEAEEPVTAELQGSFQPQMHEDGDGDNRAVEGGN